jgi:uncharacterized surface protein with fasciclin (FAS1) repeats
MFSRKKKTQNSASLDQMEELSLEESKKSEKNDKEGGTSKIHQRSKKWKVLSDDELNSIVNSIEGEDLSNEITTQLKNLALLVLLQAQIEINGRKNKRIRKKREQKIRKKVKEQMKYFLKNKNSFFF